MPYGLYMSAEGAAAQSRRIEVISNNLANVDTPGFKRDVAVFQARYAEMIGRGLDRPGSRSLNDIGGGIAVRETKTDFTVGPLQRTDLPTDVAINGDDAFFLVRREDGDYLTRAGNFLWDATGTLVTQEGDQVLDESGSPVVIDPLRPWTFSPDGGVVQNGTRVNLAMVRPESYHDLHKVGSNFFRSTVEPLPVPVEERRIVTGFVEKSGVRPTLEMMELLEASRAFEANVTLIKHQDQMIGGLTGRVLRA